MLPRLRTDDMTSVYAYRVRWFALLFALLVGAASNVRAEGSVERLMDVSGLRHSLEQLPAVILTTLDAHEPDMEMPAQIRVAMKDAARQAFRADVLLATAKDHLERSLDAQHMASAIAFYETPLGRQLTALERDLADPSTAGVFDTYARELAARPPSHARMKLIEAYDAATGSSEAVLAVMESTALAVALGLNAAQPRQAQLSSQDLKRRIREALPQVETQARLHVMASVLFTYRRLGDAEFAEYVRFLEAPSGATYARASAQVFQRIMTEAMGRLMQALPAALERARGSARI